MSVFDDVFGEATSPTEQVSPRLSAFDQAFSEVTPETVAKSLRVSPSPEGPRVSGPAEFTGGLRDVKEAFTNPSIDPTQTLLRAGGGALRTAGAPFAPLLDFMGRKAGTTLQDLLLGAGRMAGVRDPSQGAYGTTVAGVSSLADALAQVAGPEAIYRSLSLPSRIAMAINPKLRTTLSPRDQLTYMRSQVPAAKEAARRAAIEAESTPVTTAEFPAAPTAGPALARKTETGKFFGGAVARERQKAQSVFEKAYDEVRRGTAGVEYDTADIALTADNILKEAGLARKVQPTAGEAIAGRTKTALLPAKAEDAIAAAEEAGRAAEAPGSTLESMLNSLMVESKTATFNDLQVARSRARGAIRGFQAKGDFDTAKRLKPLEAAYTDTIESGLPRPLVDNLRAADELYASEFIPKFGFESPASRLAEVASEDVITKLFPTKGQVEGITKPAMTKTAVGAPEWERLSDTFWQQKILEPALQSGGVLDFKAVQKNLTRYHPDTLKEVAGYDNIKAVVDKFSEAERLTAKQIADWRLRTGVKAETTQARFKSLEAALVGKKEQVGITERMINDLATKARWVGAAGMLYPAMRGGLTFPQFVTGLGLIFTGEQMVRMLASGKGQAAIRALSRVAADSIPGIRAAQNAAVVYRGIVGAKPLEEQP